MNNYIIRKADKTDSNLILTFIRELAEYEQMLDKVTAKIEDIEKTLFSNNPKAEVLILEADNKPAGFALFFHNYSTFLCKYGIYIEDIYVREEFRGRGFGKAFFKHICKIAVERDCGRVEWWCLDWNKPSIDFYLKLGAEPMQDWTVYRLNKEEIEKIANN
ncbi:MAG: GNAT family N-acetyltransferase [Alphaproteobacteria bacterium]|nr:GNAT family N-acetyltransferase [Alphaproteobacteria bacterium]OJV13128.1 MAG: GNAT family N-acetyltransferase [Alphaproteobacteria bacterium 33-17]